MVKVAIAGPGEVAHEIIDGLLTTGRHEVVLLSRREATPEQLIPGTTWVKVDYQNKDKLVHALEGVHTVLSFIVVHSDKDNANQKALIDAAIEAGVKRIAPSEWAVANINHLPWYDNKLEIREYLKDKNKDRKVVEYTLFQPGWFMNYIAGTIKTTEHVQPLPVLLIDHENLRARVPGGTDHKITLTAMHDLVNIVVKAIEYEGEWPTVGGINGQTLSLGEEIALGEKIRGKPYQVEILDPGELLAASKKSSSLPVLNDPSETVDFDDAFKRMFRGLSLNAAEGVAPVSDEWNRIFPDYKFTTVEEFLRNVFGNA